MAKRGDPGVLRYVVSFLRFHSGVTRGKRMNQTDFGRACRVDQAEISRMELGKLAPSEEQLIRMAKAAGVEWSDVVRIREFYTVLIPSLGRDGVSARLFHLKSLEPVLLAIRPFLMNLGPSRLSADEERREADQIWSALEQHPMRSRRRLIEVSPDSGGWALAVRVCEASVSCVGRDAEEALELAELAVSIAERIPEESWRSRVEGYCWAHVANARRVANDLAGADEAFTRAWKHWRLGVDDSGPGLEDWVLPSMEASLRRDQRRFSEALKLLERAKASRGGDGPAAQIVLLLQREHIFEQMGDLGGALAALVEAVPLVEASKDARQLFAVRFKSANHLCYLEHYLEAAELLPQLRELAIQQANDLDLIRVNWLAARVAAGEGRTGEAIEGLEQVSRDFTARELPYDTALASLDLSVLWLKVGRSAEVKGLADTMVWIFQANGIAREALAALQIFCNAARQESATVKLAREVIAKIEKARRSAPSGA